MADNSLPQRQLDLDNWEQTDDGTVIKLMFVIKELARATNKDIKLKLTKSSLKLTIYPPDLPECLYFEIPAFFAPIEPHKTTSTRKKDLLEITLHKKEPMDWPSLTPYTPQTVKMSRQEHPQMEEADRRRPMVPSRSKNSQEETSPKPRAYEGQDPDAESLYDDNRMPTTKRSPERDRKSKESPTGSAQRQANKGDPYFDEISKDFKDLHQSKDKLHSQRKPNTATKPTNLPLAPNHTVHQQSPKLGQNKRSSNTPSKHEGGEADGHGMRDFLHSHEKGPSPYRDDTLHLSFDLMEVQLRRERVSSGTNLSDSSQVLRGRMRDLLSTKDGHEGSLMGLQQATATQTSHYQPYSNTQTAPNNSGFPLSKQQYSAKLEASPTPGYASRVEKSAGKKELSPRPSNPPHQSASALREKQPSAKETLHELTPYTDTKFEIVKKFDSREVSKINMKMEELLKEEKKAKSLAQTLPAAIADLLASYKLTNCIKPKELDDFSPKDPEQLSQSEECKLNERIIELLAEKIVNEKENRLQTELQIEKLTSQNKRQIEALEKMLKKSHTTNTNENHMR